MFGLLAGIMGFCFELFVLIIQAFLDIEPILLLCMLAAITYYFISVRCCAFCTVKPMVQKLEQNLFYCLQIKIKEVKEMGIKQDWLMRQIQILVEFIAHVVFGKKAIQYEITDKSNLSESDLLYNRLCGLVSERKICEAEDLLFDMLDASNERYLELAVDFYQTINQFSDEDLVSSQFSRDEIDEGLREVLNRFSISDCGLTAKQRIYSLDYSITVYKPASCLGGWLHGEDKVFTMKRSGR